VYETLQDRARAMAWMQVIWHCSRYKMRIPDRHFVCTHCTADSSVREYIFYVFSDFNKTWLRFFEM